MSVFWKAYQVEKAREISLKQKKENKEEGLHTSFYCPNCGAKIEENANFCRKCGRETK